jgi:acyl-CoA dehydrogenase
MPMPGRYKLYGVKRSRNYWMDFQLSDDQREFQKLASDFAHREIMPRANKCEAAGECPFDIYQKAFESGLINVQIPEALNGLGLDLWDACLIAEALAYGDSSIASLIEFSTIAQLVVLMLATPEQKLHYLAPLNEELSFAGIDLDSCLVNATPSLHATDVSSQIILSGTCNRLLNATHAGWYVVAALEPSTMRKRYFLVPKQTTGIEIGSRVEAIGRNLADIHQVTFQKVSVPREAELDGQAHPAFESVFSQKTSCLIAAGMVGVAESALDHAIRYANQRKTFGKPIVEHQAVGFMLADIAKEIEAARLLTWRAAITPDSVIQRNLSGWIAHSFASEMVMKAAVDAVQIFGGYGYSKEYPVEKLMRDAKAYQMMVKSAHTLQLQIGQQMILENTLN